jgi:hypothetical protein
VFTTFDPIRGKGYELTRFATDPNADYGGWGLSPDGTRIAIIKTGGNHVYLLPLNGSPVRDLTVVGAAFLVSVGLSTARAFLSATPEEKDWIQICFSWI